MRKDIIVQKDKRFPVEKYIQAEKIFEDKVRLYIGHAFYGGRDIRFNELWIDLDRNEIIKLIEELSKFK
ncbi:MAG TPA: hypothetical protein ENG40_03305 [Thermoprotei archaeon]|nr:hypothetical protein [Thermoprotei archaeon]